MTTNHQPKWDIDLAYGEAGEQFVTNLLAGAPSKFEVKTKRYLDFKFYVETHQFPSGATEWKDSGIQTTYADYWVYVVGDTGVVMFVPTERLRQAALGGREVQERDGDNPTLGRLVGEKELFKETTTKGAA
jgi:hypothetical protein